MCRLTAYLGEPIPASTLLYGGSHSLLRQSWSPRALLRGSVNADGWGVSWWNDGRAVRLARAEPAWYDPDVRGVLDSVTLPCGVAALRNATEGLPVGAAAVPPLVRGRWAFVLNGYVPHFRSRHMRALREALSDELYAELAGSSDAETLFFLVLAALEAGAAPEAALERVVATVLGRVAEEGGEECQLTLLLADGKRVVVALASNVERTNSLNVLEEGALAPRGVLVASEPLDEEPGWRPVPPHHVLTVDSSGVRTKRLTEG